VKNYSLMAEYGRRWSRPEPIHIDDSAMYWRYLNGLRQSMD